MSPLCKVFGHKPRYDSFANYMEVKRYAVDGIGREHASVHTACARCGTKYRVGMIHLIQRDCDREAIAAERAAAQKGQP